MLICVVVFLAALLPLFVTSLFPFIDFYNHLARYFVLANLDQPLLRVNFASNWAVLPNVGMDVLGAALIGRLPQAISGHVVVGIVLAAQFFGVLYLNRTLTGRWSPLVAIVSVPFLYSFILNWGFVNFLLGLGMAFIAAGLWVTLRNRPVRAVLIGSAMALLIFFVHGLAFALYGLLLGSLELGFFLSARPGRISDLAGRLAQLAAQAVLPAIMFAVSATSRVAGGATNADESIISHTKAGTLGSRLARLAEYRMETILRVAEGPSYLFDAVTLAALMAALFWLWTRQRRLVAPVVFPALAVGAALIVFCPPALFGSGYAADRMPLFFALVLLSGLTASLQWPRDRWPALMIVAVVMLKLGAIAWDWRSYARDDHHFRTMLHGMPRGSFVAEVIAGGSRRDDRARRCQMFRPLLVSRHGMVTSMFANPAQQPIRIKGDLATVMQRTPVATNAYTPPPGYFDGYLRDMAQAGYDYILVCHPERLTRPWPSGTRVVSRSGRLVLLKTGS